MNWNPQLDLTGDPNAVKVSASDIASTSACGRFLALKTRPKVKIVDGWSRLFPPKGQETPFPLADVIELVLESHEASAPTTYPELQVWLRHQMDDRGIQRLLRPYVSQSVENVLEAEEAIETEIGPLRLLAKDPRIGPWNRVLWVWAPLYETQEGIREVRRFRLGSAHGEPDEQDHLWSVTAAYVAATYRSHVTPTRVRVVEIGLVDGSIAVLFDGSPQQARTCFDTDGRERAVAVTEADHVVPCRCCGDCKAAGSCDALISVDGMLAQIDRGHASRSIAPAGLSQYAVCPARWLLDSCLRLPAERTTGENAPIARGYAVHRWLEAAHLRGIGCDPADLPGPGAGLGLAEGILTESDYAAAYPFLAQHVGRCPLADEGARLTAVESDIYAYDHVADVVPVTRPDLLYRTGDELLIREFKTGVAPYAAGRDEAYDRHLQIPFLVVMLNSGLLAHHGARKGTVELELLTETEQFVWSWDVSDPVVARIATGVVGRAVDDWHTDSSWVTRPGPHCAWCPVSRWCPDRDLWQNVRPAADGPAKTEASPTSAADEAPPF